MICLFVKRRLLEELKEVIVCMDQQRCSYDPKEYEIFTYMYSLFLSGSSSSAQRPSVKIM